MNIRSLFKLRSLAVMILIILLLLTISLLWRLFHHEIGIEGELSKYTMFFNQYQISRSNLWDQIFSQPLNQKYPTVSFEEKGHILLIDSQFVA